MILPDHEIIGLIRDGVLPEDTHVGPCSADLRLGTGFARPCVQPAGSPFFIGVEPLEYDEVETHRYLIHPGEFVLATTQEYLRLPANLAAYVHGRSSVGRAGLQVQNAGFIDAGFEGEITLELQNQAPYPIMLAAGSRICQLTFHQLTAPAAIPYAGKYQHQKGATGSKIHADTY